MEDNIKYFDYDNPKEYLDKTKELEVLLKSKDFDMFLYGGTLLGCIRDKDLIPHDDDIDLFYLSQQKTLTNVLNEFETTIRPILESNGWEIKYVYWKTNGYPQRMLGQFHVIKNNISIDLWAGWFNTDVSLNITMAIEGVIGPKDILSPIKTGHIRNYEFNIPNKSDLILTYLYGDWRTPNSTYKIPCNTNFLEK